jgi:hypothetical protein
LHKRHSINRNYLAGPHVSPGISHAFSALSDAGPWFYPSRLISRKFPRAFLRLPYRLLFSGFIMKGL